MKKYFKKNQLRYQKFLVLLKIYNYFINMAVEDIGHEFRSKNIEKASD